MEKIDDALLKFDRLRTEISEYQDSIISEQDTRVKIVDRILIEILGYSYEEIQTEPSSGEGFIDYKISINKIAKLIIEAKKTPINFNIDSQYSGRAYKLNGSLFKEHSIKGGLRQAVYYSAMESVELACLTNGYIWIIFKSNRISEGKGVFEGKAFVFCGLNAIKDEFKLFYELLSKENVCGLTYRAIFQEVEGLQIRTKEDAKSLITEDRLHLMEKGQFAYEIDRVMTEFFSKLGGDTDPNFLMECFVETKESQVAEKQLMRLSEDLLTKIRTLETKEGFLLQELIERVKNTNRHEFVILVGGKGAGKSTFVERFFENTLPPTVREQCILIRLNVGESDGNVNTILDWLNRNLLEECEKVLFEGVPSYDQLMSIYFHEYKRLSEGSWEGLYNSDKKTFRIDFGKHVENRRETLPHEHIKRMVGDITRSRKKVPCIIFDNTDHFGIEFQETVFQYARSIYEKEICLVIVPITDKTSWQLSKQGAIQSFENETLFLPTPSPLKIIEKRIAYLQKIISFDKETKVQYFLDRGIKLEISNIEIFTKTLQNIFLKDPTIMKWIGNLSNLDIRRCLDFTRDIIASPHISSDDLLKANFVSGNEEFPIKMYKIKNAIIKKWYTSYPVGHHSYVQNLYYLNGNLNTSPVLALRILKLLIDRKEQRGKEDSYLLVNEVLDYFSNMGIERLITQSNLNQLLKKGLIFSYDPTILDIEKSKKVEISPSGHEHFSWAFFDDDYAFSMLETTPICDRVFFEFIETHYYQRKQKFEILLQFLDFLAKEDSLFCQVPDHEAYLGQKMISNRFAWRKAQINRFIETKKNTVLEKNKN